MSHSATFTLLILTAVGFLPFMALLSIAETALLDVQERRIENLVSSGKEKSTAVLKVIAKTRSKLATAHLGAMLCLFGVAWVASQLWTNLRPALSASFSGIPLFLAGLVAAIFVASMYIAIGIVLPRRLAGNGLSPALEQLSIGIVNTLRIPLYPFVWIVEFIGTLGRGTARPNASDEFSEVYPAGELPYTAVKSYRYGLLGAAQRDLLTRLFDFKVPTAGEIVTPHSEMACLYGKMRLFEALDAVRQLGFTRYPVVDGTKDRVIGTVHFRDLIDGADANPRQFVTEVMDPALLLPAHLPITEVLKELQRQGVHMAIIHNDHNGIEGLVTLEDIMREFFGSTEEKGTTDHSAGKDQAIRALSTGTYEFDGGLVVHEVEDTLGIQISQAGLETIGNHIFARLGRKARIGDHVKVNGVLFDVIQMEGARITRLRAQKTRELPPDLPYTP